MMISINVVDMLPTTTGELYRESLVLHAPIMDQ